MGQLLELHDRLLRLKLDARAALGGTGQAVGKGSTPGALESKALADATELLWRVLDALYGKANFNPTQPRVPAGNSDGGQWTDGSGSSGGRRLRTGRSSSKEPPKESISKTPARHIRVTIQPPGWPSNLPPIPPEPPVDRAVRLAIAKDVARWALTRVMLGAGPAAVVTIAIQAGYWLFTYRHEIASFTDGPRSLEELKFSVSTSQKGYERHHIVEQTSALQDGFARSQVHGVNNLVRIPTWKHHLINRWYSKPSKEFRGQTPRDYLRGKSWEERQKVGLRALREAGVLK